LIEHNGHLAADIAARQRFYSRVGSASWSLLRRAR
jgi:hypothetical protein